MLKRKLDQILILGTVPKGMPIPTTIGKFRDGFSSSCETKLS